MKQKPKWLILFFLFILTTIVVNAQERSQTQSDHEISAEEELLIEEKQRLETMTVEEKAAYLKQEENLFSGKQEKSLISERARKLNDIREKENLKRNNYSLYVEMYGANTSEIIEIPKAKFDAYPETRKQYILNNPYKFKIVNKEK